MDDGENCCTLKLEKSKEKKFLTKEMVLGYGECGSGCKGRVDGANEGILMLVIVKLGLSKKRAW